MTYFFVSGTPADIVSEEIKNTANYNFKDIETKTQLLEACKNNEKNKSLGLIRELVKDGADVNEVGGRGHTPLLLSLFSGNTKTAVFLLDNGANPNLSNDNGWSPLMMACERLENDLDMIKKLIECGADVDQVSNNQCTALMSACIYQKSVNVISYLIEKGANVNAEDHMGWTALNFVCLHGGRHKASALLKAGAVVDHVDKIGQTTLNVAKNRNDIYKIIKTSAEKQK